jgi:hypothetical protein
MDAHLSVSPRLALLGRPLLSAAIAAESSGIAFELRGFPPCVTGLPVEVCSPERRTARLTAGPHDWGSVGARHLPYEHVDSCPPCPWSGVCAKAPADYVMSFGRTELGWLAGATRVSPE